MYRNTHPHTSKAVKNVCMGRICVVGVAKDGQSHKNIYKQIMMVHTEQVRLFAQIRLNSLVGVKRQEECACEQRDGYIRELALKTHHIHEHHPAIHYDPASKTNYFQSYQRWLRSMLRLWFL